MSPSLRASILFSGTALLAAGILAASLSAAEPSVFVPSPDWTALGPSAQARFGASLASAGDVDGDGYDDVVVGAPRAALDGLRPGSAFLYLGSPDGLEAQPAWSVSGTQDDSGFGNVASAGDVNGDGYDDILIGAPAQSGDFVLSGMVSVYHGSASGPSTTADWTESGDSTAARFGSSLAPAGDVNGDGYGDIIVGAPLDHDPGVLPVGRVEVYLGSAGGLVSPAAWSVRGDEPAGQFGHVVGSAGDVNGDGFDDVFAAMPFARQVRIYLGSAQGPMTEPVRILESLGSAAAAGDLDGDGFGDLVASVGSYTGRYPQEGRVEVYLGGPGGLEDRPAWVATGGEAYLHFGEAIAAAGDVNADGFDDLLVGAPHVNFFPEVGRALLFPGLPAGPRPHPSWVVHAERSASGFARTLGSAGDVNGDGYADILIGTSDHDTALNNIGKVDLYLGPDLGSMQRFRVSRPDLRSR